MTSADDAPTDNLAERHMLEALVCPRTHDRLEYDAAAQELLSRSAGLAYPIRNGIPIVLVDEARRLDNT